MVSGVVEKISPKLSNWSLRGQGSIIKTRKAPPRVKVDRRRGSASVWLTLYVPLRQLTSSSHNQVRIPFATFFPVHVGKVVDTSTHVCVSVFYVHPICMWTVQMTSFRRCRCLLRSVRWGMAGKKTTRLKKMLSHESNDLWRTFETLDQQISWANLI